MNMSKITEEKMKKIYSCFLELIHISENLKYM